MSEEFFARLTYETLQEVVECDKSRVRDNLEDITSQIGKKIKLPLSDKRFGKVNPLYEAMVSAYVSQLREEDVLPRLLQARNEEDLKAVLIVDEFLTLLKNPEYRQEIIELLQNEEARLENIVEYAAWALVEDRNLTNADLKKNNKYSLDIEIQTSQEDCNERIYSVIPSGYYENLSSNAKLRIQYFVEDLYGFSNIEIEDVLRRMINSRWYEHITDKLPRDLQLYTFFDDITLCIRNGTIPDEETINKIYENICKE